MKPYYYIYKRDGITPPTMKHETLASAHAEAERLAAREPGREFVILKAIAIARITPPAITFWMDGEGPVQTTGLARDL